MLLYELITLDDIHNVTKVQEHALNPDYRMWYIHKDHSCEEQTDIITGQIDTPDQWIIVRYADMYREAIVKIVHEAFHANGTEIDADTDEDSTTSDEKELVIGRCVCGYPDV